MADYMAQMLNELMGPQRNAMPGEQKQLEFDNSEVCRDYLVGFCLHEAFRNTKNDLGYCPYPIHDDNLKERYKNSPRYGRLGYEEKFADKLRRFHQEVRRKIEKNETRLSHTQGQDHVNTEHIEKKRTELNERREVINKRMEELMEEAEKEGEKGNVAAAQAAAEKAAELEFEKQQIDQEEQGLNEEAKRTYAMEDQVTQGNKQMQVCQVCGCFMLTNDAQSRIDDHLSGKLHIAYTRIKEHLDSLESEREDRKKILAEREKERDKSRDDRDKERDRDRRDRDRRDRDDHRKHRDDKSSRRDRGHHRDGDSRRDDRDRRDRDQRRDRSRSRDRRHR